MKSAKDAEEFVLRSREIHGSKYEYDLVVFTKMQRNVELRCNRGHPNFFQTPYSHLSGHGCKLCGCEDRTPKPMVKQEEYIRRVKETHNNYYSYSKTLYTGARRSLTVTCPVHGDFEINAKSHEYGKGCSICGHRRGGDANRVGLEESIAAANARHNFKYDYSLIADYTLAKALVPIICPEHGEFKQSFGAHKNGQGCPKCMRTGYNIGKPGSLYILVADSLLKIGITNRAVDKRISEINAKSPEKFLKHSVFSFEDGAVTQALETACLAHLSSKYSRPTESFHGSTECFLSVNLEDFLSFVIPAVNSAQ